jgi:hypothetical protein
LGGRCGGRACRGGVAACAGAQVPPGRCQLRMVLGLPSRPSFHRSAQRRRSTTPSLRRDLPARVQAWGSGRRHRQARHASHAAALFCHPAASGG